LPQREDANDDGVLEAQVVGPKLDNVHVDVYFSGGPAGDVHRNRAAAQQYVPAERLYPCTNCGMLPMARDIARRKLEVLSAGAHLARSRLAGQAASSAVIGAALYVGSGAQESRRAAQLGRYMYGPRFNLPEALSPHVTFWYWKPSHVDAQTVITVGIPESQLRPFFNDVTRVDTVQAVDGVHSEEVAPIAQPAMRPSGLR